jgi:hypothetical protein
MAVAMAIWNSLRLFNIAMEAMAHL